MLFLVFVLYFNPKFRPGSNTEQLKFFRTTPSVPIFSPRVQLAIAFVAVPRSVEMEQNITTFFNCDGKSENNLEWKYSPNIPYFENNDLICSLKFYRLRLPHADNHEFVVTVLVIKRGRF